MAALDTLDIVEPGIDQRDGCPVLRRVNAFVAQEGVASKLRYTFLDAVGNGVDLTPAAAVSESASDSKPPPDVAVLMRVREFDGYRNDSSQVWAVEGAFVDQAAGVVQASLPAEVYGQCGIYEVAFAVIVDSSTKVVQQSMLSIERTLFGFDTPGHVRTEGPPTLGEIRMALWDNAGDNTLLMSDVEFADDQILQALAWPVRYFNEQPPPLHRRYTTKDFPWRAMWLDGIRAILYDMAAAFYRRNKLPITAGGKTLNPYDRDKDYMQAAMMYRQRWEDSVTRKKVEINTGLAVGSLGSIYGGYGSW